MTQPDSDDVQRLFQSQLNLIASRLERMDAAEAEQTDLLLQIQGEVRAALSKPDPPAEELGEIIEPPPLPLVIPESSGNVQADQSPIDDETLRNACLVLRLTAADRVAEIGCGSGKAVLALLRAGAGHVVAVEIDPVKADECRQAVTEAGYADRVTILEMDAMDFDPESHQITAGYCFLWPEQLERLRPVLDKIPRLVTPHHELSWKRWSARIGRANCYRSAAVRSAAAGAVAAGRNGVASPRRRAVRYGNRYYSGRVCNNGRCRMCNQIARALRN